MVQISKMKFKNLQIAKQVDLTAEFPEPKEIYAMKWLLTLMIPFKILKTNSLLILGLKVNIQTLYVISVSIICFRMVQRAISLCIRKNCQSFCLICIC